MTVRAERTLRGRHVLFLVVGFFAAIMAVNAVMVLFALGTFPGVVSKDAYREGLEYNRTLQARAAQRALGWKVVVEVPGTGLSRRIEARFADRAGTPLTGMEVTAQLVRPVVRGVDRAVTLHEVSPGRYRAEADFPLPGHWRLNVEAQLGDDTWRMERDLWLD